MSLVGKLALSLFMGRFYSLSELGLYGLAFGAVMLAVVAFGLRVDYVVARDILGMDADQRREVGSEVALLYLAGFLLAAPFALAALILLGDGTNLSLVVLIYVLCGVEAYANYLYTLTIALKRPALANALFFLRSGLWTLPAMALSYIYPAYRTVEFVLDWWLAGVGASVVLNIWMMRGELAGPISRAAFRLPRVRQYCRSAFLIWIGSVAVTLGAYLDRFVLATFLTLRDVGVATFYVSFTTAVLSLVQSATTTVTFPVMIEHFDANNRAAFERELKRTALLAAAASFAILACLGITMPFLGGLMHKPELVAGYPAFILLIIATQVRTHAEVLYYGLFVERKHRAIWLGNMLFFLASLAFNLLFVPLLGLVGLGIAAILAALMITIWRAAAFRQRPVLRRKLAAGAPDLR